MGLSLFILLILISSTGILNGGTSCPRNQLAFDSSCYEFINKSCNFRKAEEWCEKKGGHLVFIQNDETQQFLQTHLSENHEWWIGLAPPVKNLSHDPIPMTGVLSWLDTSDVSYSNWYTDQPSSATAQCGYILKNSKFMWGATDDCNQEYFFICQHELGHAIACDHFNSTLHCGPGEVIEIDDSFYGRKSPHFCSLENATDIKLAEECSWIPVKDEISGLCQKLQECQVTSDGMSFGNPCPSLGNYLAVDYHCKEGLQISVEDIVSTFENVTISLKWLIQSPTGNLSCIINTGDRPELESYSPNSSSSVVHRYLSPGLLTITAECTSAELNITAKKAITVQAPISDWGPIRCIKKDKLEEGSNCTIPLGETFNIQVEVKEGTNITYTVIAGNITLAKATSGTGTSPCNITIDHASQKLIGPGIHQLDITADNNVTASEILQKMIINLLEPVSEFHVGLKAIILEKGETLQMNVSVAHGAPLTLIFEFIGINDTISETRKYLGSEPTVYYIPVKLEGSYLVKATAANDVSRISLDVGNITVRANASEENVQNAESMSMLESRSQDRTATVDKTICISPGEEVKPSSNVRLQYPKEVNTTYKWTCGICWTEWEICIHQKRIETDTYVLSIPSSCLPAPNSAVSLILTVNQSEVSEIKEQCLKVTAAKNLNVQIKCKDDCKSVKSQQMAVLTVSCKKCNDQYKWYLVNSATEQPSSSTGPCLQKKIQQNALTLLKSGTSTLKLNDTDLQQYGQVFKVRVIGMTENQYGQDDYIINTLPPPSPPSCLISPTEGTVFTSFSINCSTSTTNETTDPAIAAYTSLTYCVYISSDTPLACEQQPTISSVYLPLGKKEQDYNITVRISASNKVGDVVSTNVYAKVRNMALNDSKSMQNVLKEKRSELLDRESSSSLMQLYMAVSSILKEETAIEPNTKKQVKEEMLSDLPAINVSSIQTAQSVSTVLEEITQNPDELSPTAQLEASNTLISLSGSLLALQTEDGDDNIQRNTAATSLFSAMSNVLEASAQHSVQSSEKNATKQVLFTDNLMSTVTNLQSVFLLEKESGGEPTILNAPSLTMYVNRLERDQIDKSPINVTHSMSASFTLPSLSSSNLLYGVEENETVDVRMVSFAVNPFAWSTTAEINGAVGGLALTRTNGSHILVSELMEDIEITLPRLNMTQVNKTQLRLSNSSSVMVNVSSENDSLVMQFDPEKDIPLAVYLQYGFQPNQTHYDHKIQLTEEQITEDGQYTWVLNPGNLTGAGTYYLLVTMSEESNSASSANNTVEISSFVAQCLFWNETNSSWNGNGCRVGPKTTASSTQCLCNHLTFFASSFFVMPNVIDVSKTVELFATFVNNPVVVTTVGSIFLLYILVVVWARRKDIQYSSKVKLTVLEDNDPFDQYRYVLTVVTGHRRGAATTSKVTIILYGSEGESEPHHLADPEKPLFERGASDVFLLTTPFSLGELQSIRLWHDNSGSNPSWYINRVMVHDLDMDKKWYFLCNSWLSIDVGECILDKVFQVATEEDLKTFSNLFFMKTAKDFRDGHIWYSVINRPAISSFTTVQRVSCCFSLLLCTMLTSIMFYGVPKDPAEQKMDLGTIEITWQEVMIGFESSLLVFPVNLLIVQLFRHIRPRQSKEQKERKQGKHGRISPNLPTPQTPPFETIHISSLTPEAVIKDIRRIANSLSKLLKTPLPAAEKEFGKTTDINKLLALVEEIICQQNRAGQEFYDKSKKREDTLILTMGSTDLRENLRSPSPDKGVKRNDYGPYLYTRLQHVEKELDLLGPEKFQNRQSYLQAVQQVQHMKDILENQLYSDPAFESCSPPPSLPEETKKNRCSGGLPWWFVFFGWMLLAATSGVSAFFTMLYGLHYGKDRSIKWLISMAISFFESLLVTQPLKVLGLAAFFALVLKKVELEDEEPLSINGSISNQGAPNLRMGTRRDSNSNIYQPPPPTDIERMKQHRIKEQKVFALIREIVAYLGFLWMLLLVAYGQRDPNSYYLNNHIQSSFTNGFADVLSYQGFFTWANTTLINKLYGPYPGFITDGNSKLVGSARIRQIRVKKDACSIPKLLRSDIRECHTPYSLEDEDMSDYGVHWNVTVPSNASFLSNVWHYQSQSMLRGHPFWGQLDMYRGGGYVASLGTDAQNATRVLQYIFDNVWLDTYTRAIFIEFTVYNANVNLFCIVTLILETNGIGAFVTSSELKIVRLYPYTDGLHIFVIAAEVIYFLFVIYYMVVQGKLMKEQRWGYFKSKWNLLELAIILISWSALSVYIQRTILGTRDLTYYEDHRDEFVSFYDTATADTALGYLIAFLVLLATVKLWHLMRLNPKLNMITSTLKRAWDDISGFIVVIFIMFLAYSIATNLMFGWTLSSYKTVFDAAITMVSLQLGIFNYQEVLDYNPVLASFLIGTCIIFMTFVVLNLFISVILVAFSEEQINYKPSEEEEIVDLMLMKICSLFGIRIKKEENMSEKVSGKPKESPSG